MKITTRDVPPRAVWALEQGGFDLILADYPLPAFDGLSALAMARSRRPEVPFLFVSGFIGEEAALDSLQHGATDYVFKHNLARLAPALRRALVVAFTLKLDRMKWAEFGVDDQQVDPLGIDREIGVFVRAGEDFAQRNLAHRTPAGGILGENLVEMHQQPPLARIEQRA